MRTYIVEILLIATGDFGQSNGVEIEVENIQRSVVTYELSSIRKPCRQRDELFGRCQLDRNAHFSTDCAQTTDEVSMMLVCSGELDVDIEGAHLARRQ